MKPANNAAMDSAPDSERILQRGLAERHCGSDDHNSDDSDSDSDYVSFDDIEDEKSDNTKEARERERQLVLEAAGLVVNQDVKPVKPKHRPAPSVPRPAPSSQKILPTVPDPDVEKVDYKASLDDAFARYESFRNTQSNLNRLSVLSTESAISPVSPTPTTSSVAMSLTHSGNGEGRYSHFLQFLKSGSKTPEGERRSLSTLNISAPIMTPSGSNQSTPQDVPARLNTPSFGMVSPLLGPDYICIIHFLFFLLVLGQPCGQNSIGRHSSRRKEASRGNLICFPRRLPLYHNFGITGHIRTDQY